MPGRQAKVISAAQLRAALRKVRTGSNPLRNQVILLLSFKAGLRAAEIAGLTWSMVLTSGGSLADHIALADRVAKKRSGRSIPIHPDLRTALLRLRREQGCDGHVIKSQRREKMRPSSMVNWFRKLYQEMRLQGASSHSGRRTFITRLARQLAKTGGSLRDVQALSGHRSIDDVQRYVDADAHAQRRLVSLI